MANWRRYLWFAYFTAFSFVFI